MVEMLPSPRVRQTGLLLEADPFNTPQEPLDHLLGPFYLDWDQEWSAARPVAPAIDLLETGEALQICFDLPGIHAESIHLELQGNTLRVDCRRQPDDVRRKGVYHRMERRAGRYLRSVALPCPVREDQIEAEFRDGVLTVVLPKARETATHRIDVKSTG